MRRFPARMRRAYLGREGVTHRFILAAAAVFACDRPEPEPRPVESTPASVAAPVVVPPPTPVVAPKPTPIAATVGRTKEFEIRDDRAFLGGAPVELWGLRCGNALNDQGITERHVRNLDNFAAHGINLVGVYMQGSNGGWPNVDAGENGYEKDGTLEPGHAARLEWLVREADARGMVVMVGLFSPRKDQELAGEAAVRKAIEQTAQFLVDRELRNVFVDLVHEYSHERIELPIFREPDGAAKKAKLHGWWHAIAPDIEAGVCPTAESETADSFPGMQVRIIQKEMPIPTDGFVVNVEMLRQDGYDNEGKFEPEEFTTMRGYFEQYRAAPNAVLLFHSAWVQGITGKSGSGPHPEMGGYGKSAADRGIRFYFEWVRDDVGRWEYPVHVPAGG